MHLKQSVSRPSSAAFAAEIAARRIVRDEGGR
jgi:hypothetical protein